MSGNSFYGPKIGQHLTCSLLIHATPPLLIAYHVSALANNSRLRGGAVKELKSRNESVL